MTSGRAARGRTDTIVGRDGELAEIQATVRAFQRRLPQVGLEIVGEAGLGKTTLLAELEGLADRFGATVLHGRASQFERDVPFGALLTALHGLPHQLHGGSPALRHETHDHVRDLLGELARDERVLLVIDDLHWADAATLDLVGALIERPPRGAFLLAVAYRPHQRDGRLPPVVSTAAARGALRRISPQALDLGAAMELLGREHSHRDVSELHALSGGNPYLLGETARSIRAGTWTSPLAGGAGASVPPLILGTLATELLPLSPDARELLRAAAILGDPFDLDLAVEVAGLEGERSAPAVDQLAEADLIRTDDGRRRFRFRHPLIREAIRDELPIGSRRLAHGRAVRALQAAHADRSTIAHHVAQSASKGDLEAVALLEVAGREILPRSPESAAEWLSTAWNLLLADDRAAMERQTLLYPLSVALSVCGRGEEALEIIRQALATLPADSPEARRLVLGTATVEATTGGPAVARRRLERVLADASAAGEHHLEHVQMYRLAAVCSLGLGELAAARRWIEGAVTEADHLGLPQMHTTCRPTAALVACLEGEAEEAVELTERSDREFEAMDDAMLPWLIDAFVAHVRVAVGMERSSADVLIERGLRATADGLRPILAVDLLAMRSERELRRADLHAAAASAQAAADEAALLRDPSSRLYAALAMARVAAERTPGAPALEAAEEAVRAARALGMPAAIALAGVTEAAVRLAVGDEDGCRRSIAATHGGDDLPLATPIHRAATFALLVRAALAGGDATEAERVLSQAQAHARAAARHLPAVRRHLLAARAQLEHHRGDGGAARRLGEEAAQAARAAGAELEALGLDLVAARARATCGDLHGAESQLVELSAQLERCGADRLHAEAVAALRQTSRRSSAWRGDRGPHHGALTARQRQIAELAAEGRTNREIAETLVLSIKTVESHLGAAFSLLGVRSRPELRARLSERPPA